MCSGKDKSQDVNICSDDIRLQMTEAASESAISQKPGLSVHFDKLRLIMYSFRLVKCVA